MPSKTVSVADLQKPAKTGKPGLPAPSEKTIQDAIVGRLRMYDWLVVRINGNAFTDATGHFYRSYLIPGFTGMGFPDIVAFHRSGRFLLLEVKDGKGALKPSQVKFHAFAERHGIKVHVLRSPEDVARVIEEATC
jgi:hypothetical protein